MARVVVMIEDDDGNRDVWDVFRPDRTEWTLIGVGSDGSEARLIVEGAFHRRHSTPEGREIGSKMRRALES